MLDCVKVMIPAGLFIKEYKAGKFNDKPEYGSCDYNTGTRTTCFCFAHTAILECWSRAIAAKQLGRPPVILNTNKNGLNIIIASNNTVWVIYDTHNERLKQWIDQDDVIKDPNLLFKWVYDELPDRAKDRLKRLGYTTTDRYRIFLKNPDMDPGIVFH